MDCKNVSRSGAPLVMAATLVLAALPALAQRQQQPNYYSGANASSLAGKTVFLPAGTTFEGRLNTTIGSGCSRQGQVFEIEVTSPVLANGTDMIIPGGSKVDGEVVEAISSGHLPHKKGYLKPTGKLRTQLTLLHTPDGMTYPMVASLAPEDSVQGNSKKHNPNIGNSVGYVGNQASFDAVAPGAANRFRGMGNGRGPQVVTKQDLQRDPLYGKDQSGDQFERGAQIRSLMKKGHEIYIYSGSPVTIRLDGPLKIGVANAPGADSMFNAATEHAYQQNTGGRRFSRGDERPQAAPTPGGDGQAGSPDQTTSPLPFLQPGYQPPPTVQSNVIPGAVPGAPPYGGQPVAVPPQYQQQQPPQGAPGSTF